MSLRVNSANHLPLNVLIRFSQDGGGTCGVRSLCRAPWMGRCWSRQLDFMESRLNTIFVGLAKCVAQSKICCWQLGVWAWYTLRLARCRDLDRRVETPTKCNQVNKGHPASVGRFIKQSYLNSIIGPNNKTIITIFILLVYSFISLSVCFRC